MNEVSAICETAQWNPETGRQNLVHNTYRKMKGMNLEIVQSNCTVKLALCGY